MANPENTKLCDFTSTNNNDFICTPIAPPAPAANFYEIKPALLKIVIEEQFSGASNQDAAAHLNNFVELCEMQKYKNVDNDIIKLKLFPFSLRGRAKDWLLSLTKNSIDLWAKCKDALIGRYYPPAKIISLRSNIMKFTQFDNEHVAQAWSRIYDWHGKTEPKMTLSLLLSIYFGHSLRYRYALDAAAEGDFLHCDGDQAFNIIKKLITIYSMPTYFDSSLEKDKSHLEDPF
jgi:hypothetical protein